MLNWFRRRYLDVLGSIYLYNEHRGYTAIDRVLEAVRVRSPDDKDLIEAIEQQIETFVEHYNHQRYHESLNNVTPADAYFGRAAAILKQRERIKRKTIQHRRLQHRRIAA